MSAAADDSEEISLPRGIADAFAALPTHSRKDFTMPDERKGRVGTLLKIAAENAGKCFASLDLALTTAENDVALARAIPELAELAGKARYLEQRIRKNLETGQDRR